MDNCPLKPPPVKPIPLATHVPLGVSANTTVYGIPIGLGKSVTPSSPIVPVADGSDPTVCCKQEQ